MIIVGITGGICSGKSVVCSMWQKWGAYIYNSDKKAKSIINNHEQVRQKIITYFGKESYTKNKTIDSRVILSKLSENKDIYFLNQLIHPFVQQDCLNVIEFLGTKRTHSIFIQESALFIPSKKPLYLDRLLWVKASLKLRKKYFLLNRGRNYYQNTFEKMTNWQPNYQEYKHLFDHIIINNGNIDYLKSQARQCYDNFIPKREIK